MSGVGIEINFIEGIIAKASEPCVRRMVEGAEWGILSGSMARQVLCVVQGIIRQGRAVSLDAVLSDCEWDECQESWLRETLDLVRGAASDPERIFEELLESRERWKLQALLTKHMGQEGGMSASELRAALLSDLRKFEDVGQSRSRPEWHWGTEYLKMAAEGKPFVPGAERGNSIHFGVGALDDHLSCTPRSFGVIVAKSGVGKSSFLTHIGAQMASRTCHFDGARVGLISMEMAHNYVGAKWVAASFPEECTDWLKLLRGGSGRINGAGHACSEDMGRRFGVLQVGSFTEWPIIEAQVRKHAVENGVNIWMLDYFQLISPSMQKSSRSDTKAYLLGQIAYSIRAMVNDPAMPEMTFVVLAQVNRGVDGRSDEIGMDDIRDTSSLGDAVDWGVGFWEDQVFESENPAKRVLAGRIIKQRAGVGSVNFKMLYHGPTGVFEAASTDSIRRKVNQSSGEASGSRRKARGE